MKKLFYWIRFITNKNPLKERNILDKSIGNFISAILGLVIALLTIKQFKTDAVGSLSIIMFYSGLLEMILSLRSEVLISKLKPNLVLSYFQILFYLFLVRLVITPLSYSNTNLAVLTFIFAVDYRIQNFLLLYNNSIGNNRRYLEIIILRPIIIVITLLLNLVYTKGNLIQIHLLGNTLTVVYLITRNHNLINRKFNRYTRDFFKYSREYVLIGLPGNLLNYLSSNILNIFLIAFDSLSLLGIYAIANRLILFTQSIISNILTHDILYRVRQRKNITNTIFKESLIKSLWFAFGYLFFYQLLFLFGLRYLPNNWIGIKEYYWFFVFLGFIKCVSVPLSSFMGLSKSKYEILVHALLLLGPLFTITIFNDGESIIKVYLITQMSIYLFLIKFYENTSKNSK